MVTAVVAEGRKMEALIRIVVVFVASLCMDIGPSLFFALLLRDCKKVKIIQTSTELENSLVFLSTHGELR